MQDRRWCGDCREETPFEVPPCAEGHGEECPDLACVLCGAAIVVGVLRDDTVVVVHAAAA